MNEINVTPCEGADENLLLEKLADLGAGRAAQVSLVRDTQTGKRYAEKTFKSEQGFSRLFRDLLYRLCFQSPFPYRAKQAAIKACLFRRKVLRDLTEFWFGRPLVADAYYTRWDERAGAYVLGTEFIEGRGPKLGPVNFHKIRHLLHNYPVRLYKWITRSKFQKAASEPWEIREAVRQLDTLKGRFHQAGFIGSEWQVNKTLSVPTSNLLKDSDGQWVLIDVESAFPAIIFPRDIWRALRFGSVPLFDDVDFDKLHTYLTANSEEIGERLGEERVKALESNVAQLEHYTREWKEGEVALFSHRHHLLTDARLRGQIRESIVEYWLLTGRISNDKAERLRKSVLRFYRYLLADLVKSILSVPVVVVRGIMSFGRGLAKVLRSFAEVTYGTFFSEEHLHRMAESYTNERIDRWERSQRLTKEEADRLREDLQSPTTVEYLKGLVVHIAFSALTPPVITDAVIVSLAVYEDRHKILLALFFTAALRTLYTIYRAIRNRGKGFSYRYAFVIGMIPHIGILAYPAQMSFTHPELSRFLSRNQASGVGTYFPLFGGTDSRLEHFCMRSLDWVASTFYEVGGLLQKTRSILRLGRNGSSEKGSSSADASPSAEDEVHRD